MECLRKKQYFVTFRVWLYEKELGSLRGISHSPKCCCNMSNLFDFHFVFTYLRGMTCVPRPCLLKRNEIIAMICSTLDSLWKFQYFQKPIYNPVDHLWWSFYCKNSKPLSIFTKSSIVCARLGSTYASAFWRFSNVLFL